MNCNQAGSLELSIPRLSGPDDPLLASVEDADRRHPAARPFAEGGPADRRAAGREGAGRRAAAGLAPAAGDAGRAGTGRAGGPVASAARPVAGDEGSRGADPGRGARGGLPGPAAPARRRRRCPGRRAGRRGPDIAARVALLDALGATGKDDRRWTKSPASAGARRGAQTFAERAAWLRAMGKLAPADQRANVDRGPGGAAARRAAEVQEAAARALGALDPAEAARRLIARLAVRYDAGLDIASEIGLLGELPGPAATPALARRRPPSPRPPGTPGPGRRVRPRQGPEAGPRPGRADRPDEPPGPLDGPRRADGDRHARGRTGRLAAPGRGDRPAAQAATRRVPRPARLSRRLSLCDRAPLRPEPARRWRSRRWRSIREPRAIPELRTIWQKSNDLAWSGAAIRALGRLGEADIASRLLALAQDLKDPLTAPALIALGDLDETRALPLVRAGLASRSDEVVIAATRAARRLLAKPGVRADDVRDGLAAAPGRRPRRLARPRGGAPGPRLARRPAARRGPRRRRPRRRARGHTTLAEPSRNASPHARSRSSVSPKRGPGLEVTAASLQPRCGLARSAWRASSGHRRGACRRSQPRPGGAPAAIRRIPG